VAKILIVDDEPQILGLLTNVLTRAGYEIHTAGSAHEALELCTHSAVFDLVLSDVDMPGMDGHELARWVVARGLGIRVMLMSAFAHQCEECPHLPRCQVIRKPFVPGEVVQRVRAALAS
jgi:CheY-like chemotaxis protein